MEVQAHCHWLEVESGWEEKIFVRKGLTAEEKDGSLVIGNSSQ